MGSDPLSGLSGLVTPPVESGQETMDLEVYRDRCEDDEDFFDEHELRILNKRGRLQTLWPVKPGQRKIDASVYGQQAARGYVRTVIVKARRVGSTTRCVRHCYRYVVKNGGICTVIAHKSRSTKNIFGMLRRFWRQQTPEVRLPAGDVKRRDEFNLDSGDGEERTFLMSTAGTPDALRSEGNNVLHLSEVAFFDDAETLAPAALNTVADEQGMIILEGTSNGAVGWWYEFVQNCLLPDGAEGANDYEVVFISWMDDPDCVKAATQAQVDAWVRWKLGDESAAKILGMNEGDAKLAKLLGMSLEQCVWWMSKLTDGSCLRPGQDPRTIRRQEFPCTLEESFLASDRQVFSPESMMVAEQEARPFYNLIQSYHMRCVDRKKGWPDGYEHEPGSYGNLELLEAPVKGGEYVIGVDAEQGVGSDKSAGDVFRVDGNQFVQVCRYSQGSCDPHGLADVVAGLGWWYNRAFLVVERNGPGGTVIGWLRDAHCYPSMYVQMEYDAILGQVTDKFGYETRFESKSRFIGELQRLLREGRLQLRFPETIRQFKRYIRGRVPTQMGAPKGDWDDEVIGCGMAAIGRRPDEFDGRDRPKLVKAVNDPLSFEYALKYLKDLGKKGMTRFGSIT